jgi:hypothetical protein
MARPLRTNASPVIARSGSEEASSLLAALLIASPEPVIGPATSGRTRWARNDAEKHSEFAQ